MSEIVRMANAIWLSPLKLFVNDIVIKMVKIINLLA